MLASKILRSTISLSGTVAKTSAPRAIKVSVNTSAINSLGRAYAHRIPTLFQWGTCLGAVLFWPFGIQKVIEYTGGINNVL